MSTDPQLRIILAGSEHAVAAGTTAGAALSVTGRPPPGKQSPGSAVIAARINGELRDLACPLTDGDTVEPVPIGSPDGRSILRHSSAHVLAQAVQELFPEAKLGIGPPIENGFYYDFGVEQPFSPDDLAAIEKRMRSIIKQGQRFSRRVVSDDEARAELAAEPYKLELIGLKGGAPEDDEASVEVGGSAELTIYDNLDPGTGEMRWKDLCRGPHLPTTRDIPAVKLMRSGGAYWRGSEKNPQLQRIYGTAWESREALDDHLKLIAEAERRDHRRLGAELDLFSFPPEIGSGLPVFHPKGGTIRRVMEDYSRLRHIEAGYEFVNSPHLSKAELFETSGHLGWYRDSMFPPMELEGATYYPKPMNCPFHILVFQSRGRSYRELPLRLFEFGTVYRFEKSGVVHGLTRARGFTQDDSHIFCTGDQLAGELASLLQFVVGLLRDFGLTEFEAELSTRPEKFIGDPADWKKAEAALKHALDESGLAYEIAEGEGAFYAPKIDVHVRDAIGRRWQLSTLQVDFQEPGRFGMEYQAADGSRQRPYMIHRALFGSIERFFGILLEHYAGALPPWLAPVQVAGIPIAGTHVRYLVQVAARLRDQGIRVEVDASDDRMQKKIRNAQRQKVPYMLLAGDADVAAGAVSFRYRDGTQRNGVPVDEAVAEVVRAVRDRVQVLGAALAGAVRQRSNLPALPSHRRTARSYPAPMPDLDDPPPPDAAGVPDAFERLWTPHRMAYIKGENKPTGTGEGEGCPFCRLPGLPDEDGLIVARGRAVYTVLNLYPYNSGHLMVVPYRHVAGYPDLDDPETAELAGHTKLAIRALRAASQAQGFNIGMNLGAVAGAGVADHLHQHVVPRWGGDTNFMPVVGRTRVLPQLLRDTRKLLADAWPGEPAR